MLLYYSSPNMQSMLFKNVIMTNKFGYQVVPYADKRMTHKEGNIIHVCFFSQ